MKPATLALATAATAALSSFFLLPSSFCSGAEPPAPRPNIVYFLIDDMGFADCGFNGGTQIKTPNIDALSKKGVILENYYVQPLCSATRCTLMTGRTPNHHGVYGALKPESRYGLPLDERILPQLLKTAGYTSAIVGKWHCGDYKPEYLPMHRGWDHQYGVWYGQLDYFTHKSGGREDWYRDDKPLHENGYTTFLIANEAIRLIKLHAATVGAAAPGNAGVPPADEGRPDPRPDRRQGAPATLAGAAAPTVNRKPKTVNSVDDGGSATVASAAPPLFLYVPFNAVHGPFEDPPEYEKPYAALKPTRRTYAGMLAAADEAIGQIYAALVETGMADNTLIIFSSDNGGVQPGDRADNTPLRDGKGSIYEGGLRSCAFVIWPNHIAPNTRATPPVQLADWYPTLAALTGADISPAVQKKKLDGQNILPLLLEGKAPDRDALLIVGVSNLRYILRQGDWKLLVNPSGPSHAARHVDPDDQDDTEVITTEHLELYNLATDIGEQHDLATTYPDRVKQMFALSRTLIRDAVPPLAATTTPAPKSTKTKKK